MTGTSICGRLELVSRVVGVGEVVSWPEYRLETLRKPEPIRRTGFVGETFMATVMTVTATFENRRARRRAAAESRRAR